MRVLVIDDDDAIRETLAQLLDEEGFHVEEAINGLEALRAMLALDEPMVALLDLWMPRMNGEATLKLIFADEELARRVGLIVMTANPSRINPDLRAELERRAIPVVVKPFDIDVITILIEDSAQRLRAGQGEIAAQPQRQLA